MSAVDFNSPAVIADPYPVLADLRAGPPVQWNDSLSAWCVFAYPHVRAAFREQKLSSDRIRPFARHAANGNPDIAYLGECIGLWMVFNDPPVHTRLRKLVQMAFLPAAIEALRPVVAQQVDTLLENVKAKGADADFVRDFAYPLPANVIADMLGVPVQDVDQLKTWSDDLARFVLTSRADPGKYRPAADALRAMNAYFADLIAARRARPGEKIIDRLIAAHAGDDLLTLDELLASCVLLLFAGHETTTHFFSSGMRALHAHPAQLAVLRNRAGDAAAVKTAVNEMLRYDGPIVAVSRIATGPVELSGVMLKEGDRAYLFPAAANRDGSVFQDAERFDITRAYAMRMISFGFGMHTCLGLHLAWLEGEVVWPRIVRELDGWSIAPHTPEFTSTLVVRGVKALPMAPG